MRRAFAVVAAVAALAGCGAIPTVPGPLPTDFVPSPTASPSTTGILLSADGFDAATRMTVRVRSIGCADISRASGFMLDEHTLVTNRHVIEDSTVLEVSTYDGHSITATAATTTNAADLAVIRVEEPLTAAANLADEDPIEGDAVTVVGYPGGGRLTTTQGVVLGTVQDPLDSFVGPVLVTTAGVEPGSSGSPVLNADGEVVGVVYAMNQAGQSFVIPVSTLRVLLEQESLNIPHVTNC